MDWPGILEHLRAGLVAALVQHIGYSSNILPDKSWEFRTL
jgi:hypothetical protein